MTITARKPAEVVRGDGEVPMRRILAGGWIGGALLVIAACGFDSTEPSRPSFLTFTAEGRTDSGMTCCLDARGGGFYVRATADPVGSETRAIELRLDNVRRVGVYDLTPEDPTREARFGRDWVTTFSTHAPGGGGRVTITDFSCGTTTVIDPEYPSIQSQWTYCYVGGSFNFVAGDSSGARVEVTGGRFYLLGSG